MMTIIISEYKHKEKSMKALFILYADMKSFLEKTNTCHNNPEKSLTTKKIKHRASGY